MAKLVTTAGHKRINLPHTPGAVDFVDGVAEVSDEDAAEVLEHYKTSVIRLDEPAKKTTKSSK